jgi:predicted DNA-binding transcriptional regulator
MGYIMSTSKNLLFDDEMKRKFQKKIQEIRNEMKEEKKKKLDKKN